VASQDSRLGAFSPPCMVNEYYVGWDANNDNYPSRNSSNAQSQTQPGTDNSSSTQVLHDDRK
jgi:hypothetical protein